jgi:hypothetical protein
MFTRVLTTTAALVAVILGGCVAPTKIEVTRTVTKGGGVVEETRVVGEALPKNWGAFYLNWAGVIEVQGGDVVTVQPDYEMIFNQLDNVWCARNPGTCGQQGD